MSNETKNASGKRRLIVLLILFVILAAILVTCIVWVFPRMTKKPQSDPGPTVVLTCDSCSLTNESFAFYYWSEYLYYLNQTEATPFDTAKPLSEQAYDETMSWQDYLIRQALLSAEQTIAFSDAAENEGFALPEDYQAQLDAQIDTYLQQAARAGTDLKTYLETRYGKGARESEFRDYLRRTYLATAYTDHLYESFVITPEQADAYLAQNRSDYETLDGFGDTTRPCALRCLFLNRKSDVSDQQLLDQAQMLYTEWEKDPTEETFAKLAAVYNEDDGGADGLYSAVYPGQMETVVDAWCFSPVRVPGDGELLPAENGYVLVYYIGLNALNREQLLCEEDLRYELFRNATAQCIDECHFLFYPELVSLKQPSGLAQ